MVMADNNETEESEFEFLQQAKKKLELLTENLQNKRRELGTLADQPKMLMRQTITGDKTKRVRDHVKEKTAKQREKVREKLQQPPVVRFLDKAGFLLGVVGLSLTLWIFARYPQHFWWWYVTMITTLVSIRYWMYRQQKWQYFLIDFCYFAQASLLCNLFLFPQCTWLWKANYVISHGPLLWAIPTWRNSFVFHSLDKVTSIFLHGLAPLVTYCVRWHPNSINGESEHFNSKFAMCSSNPNQPCWISLSFILTYPVLLYLVWQILYILKTELLDREKISHDPMLATSIRWLSEDNSNGMNRFTLMVCRKSGLFGKTETFNSETWKTKIIFWVVQFLYTAATFLPTYVSFHSIYVNGTLLWVIFFISVWNGANYYIDIFSKRYALKFNSPPLTAAAAANIPTTASHETQNQSGIPLTKESLEGSFHYTGGGSHSLNEKVDESQQHQQEQERQRQQPSSVSSCSGAEGHNTSNCHSLLTPTATTISNNGGEVGCDDDGDEQHEEEEVLSQQFTPTAAAAATEKVIVNKEDGWSLSSSPLKHKKSSQ